MMRFWREERSIIVAYFVMQNFERDDLEKKNIQKTSKILLEAELLT